MGARWQASQPAKGSDFSLPLLLAATFHHGSKLGAANIKSGWILRKDIGGVGRVEIEGDHVNARILALQRCTDARGIGLGAGMRRHRGSPR